MYRKLATSLSLFRFCIHISGDICQDTVQSLKMSGNFLSTGNFQSSMTNASALNAKNIDSKPY